MGCFNSKTHQENINDIIENNKKYVSYSSSNLLEHRDTPRPSFFILGK